MEPLSAGLPDAPTALLASRGCHCPRMRPSLELKLVVVRRQGGVGSPCGLHSTWPHGAHLPLCDALEDLGQHGLGVEVVRQLEAHDVARLHDVVLQVTIAVALVGQVGKPGGGAECVRVCVCMCVCACVSVCVCVCVCGRLLLP